MIISESKVQDKFDNELLIDRILQIGAGELDLWKISVHSDDTMFKQVYSLITSHNPKLAWRSAWIIDNAAENHPEILVPFIPDVVAQLLQTKNSSLKRIFTRMLGRHEIPEELLAPVVDYCFKLLSPAESPAVRVNAMQVLYNVSQKEPGLKQELAATLESLLEEGGSAGFINRTEKLIRSLHSQ
jgi:hypothetical protein